MTPEQAFAEAMKFENRPNPYPFFDELRKTPVARVTNGIYAVTGYKEIIALAHDPRVSSDLRNSDLVAAIKSGDNAEGAAEVSEANSELMEKYGKDPSMITSDPPNHDRTRRQAMRHFGPPHSPDLIPSMEAYCVAVVNDLLDKARAKGKTRIDVVDDYAYPLPVAVICRVLGVPLKDEAQFHIWIGDFLGGVDLGPEAGTEEGKRRLAKGRASRAEFAKYMIGLIESAEKNPTEGMISQLVHDTGPDGRMSSSEILTNCALLLVAGHDSTVNLLTNCVLTLLRNPGSMDMLRRRPELVPRAIEEVLRLESSVQFFPSRSALADIEINGTTIPKGAPIFLIYAAGNRDPEQFTNPDRFDLEREEKESLGWGSGIHTCFGGPLARLEVNVGLEAFLRRVKNPRLVVDPPPYRPSQVFRGPLHLLVDIDGIGD
ncbi:MAG TPA: cytochrome P450 [Candidatus Angelobacter sp.]